MSRVIRTNSSQIGVRNKSIHMPPIPPANRSNKGQRSGPKKDIPKDAAVTHESLANAAEEGEAADTEQGTLKKDVLRGHQLG